MCDKHVRLKNAASHKLRTAVNDFQLELKIFSVRSINKRPDSNFAHMLLIDTCTLSALPSVSMCLDYPALNICVS